MAEIFPYLLLYLFGLGLFFLELFIPSGGAIGLGAILCVLYALWEMNATSPLVMWICVIFTGAYLFLLFRWGIRRVQMKSDLAGGVATGSDVLEAQELIGAVGEVVSALRPSGVALFNGKRFDVVSRGGFIAIGDFVEVVETSGNRIVVKASRPQ